MEFNSHFFIEAFGYIASLTIVFSLTRTSVKKLWIINGFGAFAFIIYALVTKSYPTALMNLGALVIDIVLDYVTDKFRDCKIGRYFFGNTNPYFTKQGITELVTHTNNPKHQTYLESLQFKSNDKGDWTKEIHEPQVAMI